MFIFIVFPIRGFKNTYIFFEIRKFGKYISHRCEYRAIIIFKFYRKYLKTTKTVNCYSLNMQVCNSLSTSAL